ncbi:F-actin-capping protein subunit alpha [Tulasnella sp. JGI-2019a]|nr:F-actin-capping protein subunit alpha [Tulasnella sp. JGI-2019a]
MVCVGAGHDQNSIRRAAKSRQVTTATKMATTAQSHALHLDDPMSIASSFLLQSPPGEINDVLNDVRAIIANDAELEHGIHSALEEYNLTQFTTVDVPGHDHKVVICNQGRIGNEDASTETGELQWFLDPRSKTKLCFNHSDLSVSQTKEVEVDENAEPFRASLEAAVLTYIHDHFHDGVASVYSSSSNVFTVVIVANKYNPANFWSGRWRARYKVDIEEGLVSGKILINVHYYEQGNVQLQTTHTPSLSVGGPHPLPATSQTAAKLLKLIEQQDGEYQQSLVGVYSDMSEKTFKGLRRALPMTRSKMDWDKVLGYKLGAEISASNAGKFGAGAS